MNLINFLYRQSWGLLLTATVGAIFSGVSGAGLIALIGQGITSGDSALALGLVFLGLGVLQLLSKSVSEIALMRCTQGAVAHLRLRLSHSIISSPFAAVQKVGKSELLVLLTKDIETFVSAVQYVPALFAEFVVLVCCLTYMAWLSWQMLVILLVCLAVCVTGYRLAERAARRQLDAMRRQLGVLFAYFRDLTEGNKELRLNAQRRAAFFDEVLGPATSASKDSYERAMSGFTWVINVGTLLFYVVIGLLIFLLPRYLPYSTAALTKLTLVLLYLIRPISALSNMMPAVAQSAAALRRLDQFESGLGASAAAPAPIDSLGGTRPLRLELRGVSHRYPSDRNDTYFQLGPIDLTIEQGEVIFFVGGNGSGKTTLAMLLLGLYAPEAGAVLLNGVPVTSANETEYRNHFSAVFSDFHLFEHLLLPMNEAVAARASHYIARLGLSHKVRIENGRFTTLALSTGQRKRLALVVAYLEDRPIYVFDEWAADQDPAFREVFYVELLPELKARGKTVIAITHDDRYFAMADRLVRLQDGRLFGTAAASAEEKRMALSL